ncbi:class I SAM-dependent methyltransferase [Dendrosporobacter sp. 1207_IL3150]|uniref:class I SAM-dependent methyltransferase n=1 Tax=Dendrosporobacter sp. 1207_IL3150 TaxID=3084054 RepID=UPI002FDA2976
MLESELRPHELIKNQVKMLEDENKRLLSFQQHFVSKGCPCCDSHMKTMSFQKEQFCYFECVECETLYIDPRPTSDLLKQYYVNSDRYAYWNKYVFPATEKVRKQNIYLPRVAKVIELCHKYNVGLNSLVEVGAGFGSFAEEMLHKQIFKEVSVIEPIAAFAHTCRNKGLQVIEEMIEDIPLKKGQINVLVAFELIEHLYSPSQFLHKCQYALADDGLLILTCPNVKGFEANVLRELSSTFAPEHLNYFHPKSISRLLERCGFDIVEIATPGSLDAELVRNRVLQGEFDIADQPFLYQVLVERWDDLGRVFQDFLATNNLSSHMWVVARKAKGTNI